MLPKSNAVQIISSKLYSIFLLDIKFPLYAILALSLSTTDRYKNEKQNSEDLGGINRKLTRKASA